MLFTAMFIFFLLYYLLSVRIIYNIFLSEHIKHMNNYFLLIAIISCNRYIYLNRTLYTALKHIKTYERQLNYNFYLFDQGTLQRYTLTSKYGIFNSFYMNPSTYSLSFNILFSYLYSKYLFILEEDWEVKHNIEQFIYYPSFILEAMLVLENYKNVYGILLREIRDIDVNYSTNVLTDMGIHKLNVLTNMKDRYTFTNGACIYRCSDLLNIKIYKSEYEVSQFFKKRDYRLGFTYKGKIGRDNSTNQQSVMMHIGKKSTKSGTCNISLY